MKKIFLAFGALTCTAAGAAIGVLATKEYFYRQCEDEIAEMRKSCRDLVKSNMEQANERFDTLKQSVYDFCDEETAKNILKTIIPFDIMEEGDDEEDNEDEDEDDRDNMKIAYHTIVSQRGYRKPDLSELSNTLNPARAERLAEQEHPEDDDEEEEVPEEAFEESEEELTEKPKENSRAPYLIKYEDMGVDEDGRVYDIDTLMYYSGDDTLCDEDERILATRDYVGDCLDMFTGNVIYVRNEKLGMDFEIVWSDKAYANVVMGYISEGEDEKDNPARKERRRRE